LSLFAGWKVSLPVQLFKDIGLDGEHVKLLASFSGEYLLNGSKEGLGVKESIQEGHRRLLYWVILPGVKLIQSLP